MPVHQKKTFSRKLVAWLPWISALVLVAGLVAFTIAYFGTTGEEAANEKFQPGKPTIIKEQKQVKSVPPGVRTVAGEFINTAVARRNLDEGWKLTHPELKAGITLKEWLKGNIPVIPYPVGTVDTTLFKVDEAYPREILMSIAMIPKKGAGVKPALFKIGLKATGKGAHMHWLVNYWGPGEGPVFRSLPGEAGGAQ